MKKKKLEKKKSSDQKEFHDILRSLEKEKLPFQND